jgi:hypothetical protein
MYSKALYLALAAAPFVAAHGKIAVVTGDAGGNGTALGIMGGVVPGPGSNKVTEPDTTVFGKVNIATDGLGKTKGNGANTMDMMSMAMAQSGDVLPQVSSTGGQVSGTFHIVTTDGAGPVAAMLDPTGTGAFASGTKLNVATQVPGTGGNIKPPKIRSLGQLYTRSMDVIMRRASNVNTDHPVAFDVPAGTTCSGTVGGQSNVCLVKIANSNKAGPFGGVVAVQMVNGAAVPVAGAEAPAAASAKKAGAARRAATFSA